MTIPMPGEFTQSENEPPITLAEISAEQPEARSADPYEMASNTYRKCPYCAEEILAEARLCKHCGNLLEAGVYTPGMPVPGPVGVGPKTSGFAIASLVLGLIPLTCVPSLLAIIFGHIALSKISANPERFKGRKKALCGTILGYIFTACNIIYGIYCGLEAAKQAAATGF